MRLDALFRMSVPWLSFAVPSSMRFRWSLNKATKGASKMNEVNATTLWSKRRRERVKTTISKISAIDYISDVYHG